MFQGGYLFLKIHPYIHPNPLVTPMNCHKLSTWIFFSNHFVLILVALKKSACKADIAPKQYSIAEFLMLYCNHSHVRTCGSIKQKTSRKHLQSKQHVDSITSTAEKTDSQKILPTPSFVGFIPLPQPPRDPFSSSVIMDLTMQSFMFFGRTS